MGPAFVEPGLPEDVVLAPAGEEDVEAVFRIRTAVSHNHLDRAALAERGITPAWVRHLVRHGALRIWGAWTPERDMVGFCAVKPQAREIFGLFVVPGWQGRGVGSALLDTAVDHLWRGGAGTIGLETGRGTPAHGFYLRRGWVEVASDPEAEDVPLRLRTGAAGR